MKSASEEGGSCGLEVMVTGVSFESLEAMVGMMVGVGVGMGVVGFVREESGFRVVGSEEGLGTSWTWTGGCGGGGGGGEFVPIYLVVTGRTKISSTREEERDEGDIIKIHTEAAIHKFKQQQ